MEENKPVQKTEKVAPQRGERARKKKNYNTALVRRVMKEATGGQYRISKEVIGIVSRAVEEYLFSIAQDAALFAANAGRCTIKARDVKSVLAQRG